MDKRANVLLISPDFFNYSQIIKSRIEKMGYNVDWFSDRNSVSFIQKAILRIKKSVLKTSIKKYLERIIEFTSDKEYAYVIVINGEILGEEFVNKLRSSHQNAQFVLYMWDSLENFTDSKKILKCFDRCYSFDNVDCENYGLNFLPLFYYDENANDNYINSEKIYDYAFIGTIKRGKFEYVKSILDELDGNFNKPYKYLFLQSRLVYFYYKIKFKEFKEAKMSMFRYKRLSTKKCGEIMSKAKIVVDVPMKHQNGLTIRTFETLSRGQKLITSNENIKDYDFYNEEQIYVYDGKTINFDNTFFKNTDCAINPEIKKYFIDEWLTRLMSLE